MPKIFETETIKEGSSEYRSQIEQRLLLLFYYPERCLLYVNHIENVTTRQQNE